MGFYGICNSSVSSSKTRKDFLIPDVYCVTPSRKPKRLQVNAVVFGLCLLVFVVGFNACFPHQTNPVPAPSISF